MGCDAGPDRGPLDGLRVVEIAGGIPAAFCARQLRGFGAETVRVERVAGLEVIDGDRPGVAGTALADQLTDDQRVFLVAGARRFTLDGPAALSDLAALLDGADVVVEDQGPGFLRRLGFDPAKVTGRSSAPVITSLSPLGHDGPRSHWQATNAVQFALGGLMTLTGDPGREPLVTGGDQALFLGGLHGFAATVMALAGRARTGRAAWVDLSMQEAAASMAELYAAQSEYDLKEPVPRAGNSLRAVWGVYPCADG
ncbi:MAG: CoA transferase, partial [Acidimicrobiia bacterium]|nr:CoA transferase [Acidimicrobiia bacterium]